MDNTPLLSDEKMKKNWFGCDPQHCNIANTPTLRETGGCNNFIIEHLDVGVVILDRENKKTLKLNNQALEILDEIGLPADFLSLNKPFGIDDIKKTKDVDRRSESVRLNSRHIGFTLHRGPEGLVCLMLKDITEKRRLEAIAEASNLMDNIGYIFAGIRHELGNPINSIKTTITVLNRKRNTINSKTRDRLLDQTLQDIKRVEYLLKNLRSFGAFEETNIEIIHIQNFIRNFIKLISKDLTKRGVLLQRKISPQVKEIEGDERALQQALLNLISNSLDALENHANPIIKIEILREGRDAVFRVIDNGCGMSPDEVRRIFEPFRSSKPGGNGLGMVITKKMITSMNGQIEVESEKDSGTTVSITFPRSALGKSNIRKR